MGDLIKKQGDIIRRKTGMIKEATGKGGDVIVGFSNEMGALYVSKGSGKSVELFSADVEKIIKTYKKFKRKLD